MLRRLVHKLILSSLSAFLISVTGFTGCAHVGGPPRNDTTAAAQRAKSSDVAIALEKLHDHGVPANSSGVLLLRRYEYYVTEIEAGRGFANFRPGSIGGRFNPATDHTPPVYDLVAFAHVRQSLDRIVENSLAGRDALDGLRGFLERAYVSETDHSLDSYLVYVPQSYDPARPHPLVVLLHGYGESAYLPQSATVHDAFLSSCERHGVILVAPNGKHSLPGTVKSYKGDGELDVLQVIALVKAAYNVAPDRVYLTGLSMGGFGTWYIGTRHPELFAAIAPTCGYGTGSFGSVSKVDVLRLAGIPTYVTHGDADPTVPVSESRTLVSWMRKAGLEVTYDELPGVAHDAWDYVYDGDRLLDQLLQHGRPPSA